MLCCALLALVGPLKGAEGTTKFDVERLPAPNHVEQLPAPAPMAARAPLVQPNVSVGALPSPLRGATPTNVERGLPINLATALRLSEARPLLINAAQASMQVALMQLERARVLWLPNL